MLESAAYFFDVEGAVALEVELYCGGEAVAHGSYLVDFIILVLGHISTFTWDLSNSTVLANAFCNTSFGRESS